ncbi:MAG: hypothetical protein OQJ89_02915 [Kangiellaceae bacterium]|nr:hypothetical protein [Kangiellaceae bacterium]MCW8997365.1 hypothetical protein [Kangiellaceae bacterium]MCW9015897.1 hypothetical protein [Kangiellaceae bacterium]
MTKKSSYAAAGIAAVLIYSYVQFDNNDQLTSHLSVPADHGAYQPAVTVDGEEDQAPTDSEMLPADRVAEQYLKYQALFNTRSEFRSFFSNAEFMDDKTKIETIGKLELELEKLNRQEKVSHAESLMLQLALLKFDPDRESAKAKGKTLIEQYEKMAEARNQEFINNPTPEFKSYKDKEKQVVTEVLSMEAYPDGLTRDEYLAKRLAEVRSEVYGGG